VLEGHNDRVAAVAWSPDGTTLVTVGRDDFLRFWSREGQGRAVDAENTGSTALAWSPDGTTLATAAVNDLLLEARKEARQGNHAAIDRVAQYERTLSHPIRLWDPASGRCRAVLEGHKRWAANCQAWSPDGTTLASGGCDNTIRLWDPHAGQLRAVLKGHRVSGLAWSPDSKLLASAHDDQTVRLWAPDGREGPVLWGHARAVKSLAWSPDGTLLASGSEDNTVRLWEPARLTWGTVEQEHERPVRDLAWSPDGGVLASGSEDRTVRLWDPTTGEPTAVLGGHVGDQIALAWSPDGSCLASTGAGTVIQEETEHLLYLWERGGRLRAVLAHHRAPILTLAWSPDGTTLAGGGADRSLYLWDFKQGTAPVVLPQRALVVALAWSPDGSWLAAGDTEGLVCLWPVATGQGLSLRAAGGQVLALAWSPDGSLLAVAGDKVRVWQRDGRLRAELEHSTHPVFSIAVKRLQEGTGVVQTDVGRISASYDKLHKAGVLLAWSPDGNALGYAGAEGPVTVWDSRDNQVRTCRVSTGRAGALRWSPDGRLLASGHEGVVRLWDPGTGACAAVSRCSGLVLALQFSGDGTTLRAADDGSSLDNRPLPYLFAVCRPADAAVRQPPAPCAGGRTSVLALLGEREEREARRKQQEELCRQAGREAQALQAQGNWDGALAKLRHQERLLRELENGPELAITLLRQAVCLEEVFAQPEEALRCAWEAWECGRGTEELATSLRTTLDRLATKVGRQVRELEERGQLDEALAGYAGLEPMFHAAGNKDWLHFSLTNRARILMCRLEHDAALALFQEAERLARELNRPESVAKALFARAGILGLGKRQTREALLLLEQAHRLAVSHRLEALLPAIQQTAAKILARP
jgi:WD40 repeat protein/tetratricopeptide (TPR) repeat protein